MKNNEIVHNLFDVDSSFTDFTKFEVDKNQRTHQRRKFIAGEVRVPDYTYPEFNTLYDVKIDEETGRQSILSAKKLAIQFSVMELDSLKQSGDIDPDIAELYSSFYELRLKRIFLVEAARELYRTRDSHRQESLRRSFIHINQELYGEFNDQDFTGILHTESERLAQLDTADTTTARIFEELTQYFDHIPVDIESSKETQLLDSEFINQILPVIRERYDYIWNAVPDTGEDVMYSASQCREIIDEALRLCGLSEKGWKAVVNAKKKAPSTSSDSKKVSLPSTTKRNADQLRALIIHEVGVHAQRAQNGEDTGSNILKGGTADYADVEEGLGVVLECIVNGSADNPAMHRARDRYITAGLALGRDGGSSRDARNVYEILWRIIASRKAEQGIISVQIIEQAKEEAYDHIENAYRGTNFAMPGMIYQKLKVYREGLIKNIEYFRANIGSIREALDSAMIGKYNHTDVHQKQLVMHITTLK